MTHKGWGVAKQELKKMTHKGLGVAKQELKQMTHKGWGIAEQEPRQELKKMANKGLGVAKQELRQMTHKGWCIAKQELKQMTRIPEQEPRQETQENDLQALRRRWTRTRENDPQVLRCRLLFRRQISDYIYHLLCSITNYQLERSLYVKLKDWISNSVDPDETALYGSTVFAKAYDYLPWQWKS